MIGVHYLYPCIIGIVAFTSHPLCNNSYLCNTLSFTRWLIKLTKNKTLLIVSNTPSSNTQALADAAVRGASHVDINNIEVKYLSPFDTTPEDVMNCDAILLGTTENFGYMSGAMKDFFDRILYPCLEHTEALPYAIFIRAGLDGTGTEIAMQKIISGLKWKQAQDVIVCQGEFKDEFVGQVEELGMSMAAGLEMGIF